MSISRREATSWPSSSSTARPPRFVSRAPGVVAYSGCAGESGATSRRGAPPSAPRSALTSSGRQIPTSEQRGHFGLSTSGGGGSSRAATSRTSEIARRVEAISASPISTMCLVRVSLKYTSAWPTRKPASRKSSTWAHVCASSGSHRGCAGDRGRPRLYSIGTTESPRGSRRSTLAISPSSSDESITEVLAGRSSSSPGSGGVPRSRSTRRWTNVPSAVSALSTKRWSTHSR
jgi:hypothetical protein